jgi:hypothetical protein
MSRMLGNTVRVLAVTGALAATAPGASNAETPPSLPQVDQTLANDYFNLAYPTNKNLGKKPISENHVGNLAVRLNSINFDLNGSSESGADVEIQVDAFDKQTHTIQESVINIFAPRNLAAVAQPNSLFQIVLYRAKYNRALAPKTPAGYNAVINSTANKSSSSQYDFNLGMDETGSWHVMAYHSQDGSRNESFTSNETADTTATISQNFDAAKALVAQGGRVLKEIEKGDVLSQDQPTDLLPRQPR